MLIPRFSVRWLLALMAICAVVAYVASLAMNEEPWAMSVLTAIAALLLVIFLHSLGFLMAWSVAGLLRLLRGGNAAASPFATHSPPPQLIKVEDPD